MMKWVFLCLILALVIFAVCGIDNKLVLKEYIVKSKKAEKEVKLLFLSDLHFQKREKNSDKLFEIIKKENVDCILLGGDILDKNSDDTGFAAAADFAKKIAEFHKDCFFVTGNHEIESGRAEEFITMLEKSGVKVLCGDAVLFTAKNFQQIYICGVDNAALGEEEVTKQKENIINTIKNSSTFSVLLRHVPMWVQGDENFDLILSGHNHGGLWRLPKAEFGVAGGGKKIFPKYVHGKYKIGGTELLVGSGITTATYLLPRIYNPPEVLLVRIKPEI